MDNSVFLLKNDSLTDECCRELYAEISHRFCDEEKRKLRKETLCGRLLLNYVLTQRCSVHDYRVLFTSSGKPYLQKSDVHFSISHSGEYVMLAVSDREVGCDIELVGEYKQRIADRFFTGNERSLLSDSDNKTDTFFRLWVLKESILKLRGEGIGGGLDSFDFSENAEKNSFSAFGYNFRIFGFPGAFACVCGEGEWGSPVIISYQKFTDLLSERRTK